MEAKKSKGWVSVIILKVDKRIGVSNYYPLTVIGSFIFIFQKKTISLLSLTGLLTTGPGEIHIV
jgi:hypothetical protein